MNRLTITCLLFFSHHALSSGLAYKSLEEEVTEAVIVFKGVLLDKTSKLENMKKFDRNEHGEIVENGYDQIIFTTFRFKVNEILKGDYDREIIEVKMKGGCSDELNACMDTSWSYDYAPGEEALMFLKYRRGSQLFIATRASYTAFEVRQNKLYRKYNIHHQENQSSKVTMAGELTIEKIRNAIDSTQKTVGN
jgi:hypothetical protein